GNVLHCDIASMASGGSFSVTVGAATTAATCTSYPNTAYADADNNAHVSDTGLITCQAPNLSVVKTPDGQTINAGDNAVFTITVSNAGPGTAVNVDLDDTLPAGL